MPCEKPYNISVKTAVLSMAAAMRATWALRMTCDALRLLPSSLSSLESGKFQLSGFRPLCHSLNQARTDKLGKNLPIQMDLLGILRALSRHGSFLTVDIQPTCFCTSQINLE